MYFGMEKVGIFLVIWYILLPFDMFGTFLIVLVCCSKKNLASLPRSLNCFMQYLVGESQKRAEHDDLEVGFALEPTSAGFGWLGHLGRASR
jgi:hypothetical protein